MAVPKRGDQMNDTSQDTGRGKGWKGKLFPFCAEKYWCTRPWQHLGQGNPFMRSGCSISIQNCHCIKLSPGWSQISINLSIYSSMLLAVALCESTGCRGGAGGRTTSNKKRNEKEALRWDLMRFPDIWALVGDALKSSEDSGTSVYLDSLALPMDRLEDEVPLIPKLTILNRDHPAKTKTKWTFLGNAKMPS